MRKAKTRKGSSAPKRKQPKTVDEYLAHVSESARATLDQLRAVIRAVVPRGATEVISYGIPAFRQKRVIVWYAAFSNHCSLFPTNSVIERFKDKFRGFSTSKGTIQFPLDKPLPVALIKKLVKARIAEAESRERA